MKPVNKKPKPEQEENDSILGSYEERRRLIGSLNLFDDPFFREVMQHQDAAEYVLRICMDKPDLKIIKMNVQQIFTSVMERSIVLDFVAEDSEGRIYNIEVQTTDDKRYFGDKRARLHQSLMDASFFKKGATCDTLPEMYIIFITPFNPLAKYKRNKLVYYAETVIDGDIDWHGGVHQIYINSAVIVDNSKLSELMQYFLNTDPNNMNFGALSKTVSFIKNSKEGVDSMSKQFENFMRTRIAESLAAGKAEGKAEGEAKGAAEKTIKIVRNLLNDGIAFEKALKLADIDEKTYNKYSDMYGNV